MSEIVSSLPDDYATVERPIPHRETILRQTMHSYVKRYGQDTPLDLDRLNSVLAAAMGAWYGEKRLGSILHLPPMPRPPIDARAPTLDELIGLQPKSGGDGRRGRI